MNKTLIASFALAILLIAGVSVGAAGDIYGVDGNHDLDSEQAVDQYQEDGIATGDADDLNLKMTITEDCSEVGHDPLVSPPQTCLKVDYDEEVARTIRVYIPRDYWIPHDQQNMRSVDGDVTAEMEPIQDRQYTAITIHLSGESESVFTISEVQSGLWGARERMYRTVNGSVGINTPRIAGSDNTPWKYVSSSEFTANESYSVQSEATVQYDARPGYNETSWQPVPDCGSRAEAPVCTLERNDGKIIIPEDNDNVPTVRYNTQASISEKVSSGIREVRSTITERFDGLRGLFGGGE